MAGLPFKRGLNPVQLGAASKYTGGFQALQASAAEATAIFYGDLVGITANGFVQRLGQTADVSADNPIGVAVGGFWIDPTSKQPVESRYIPATTSSRGGTYNGINFSASGGAGAGVNVITDLDQVYAIKFDSSVPRAELWDRADVKGTGGSTVNGQSSITATVSGADAESILQIVGVFRAEETVFTATSAGGTNDNDWNAAETVCLVKVRDRAEV